MYDIEVKLLLKNGHTQTTSVKVGLRKLEFIKSPFHFLINDVPIYMKGASQLPMDYYPDRMLNDHEVEWLIDSAIASNFNLIRIWGGGAYMSDKFYQLADAKGIMVWQEMMFSGQYYPVVDDKFLQNALVEVREQAGRLQHHACIIYWVLNNDATMSLEREQKSPYFQSLSKKAQAEATLKIQEHIEGYMQNYRVFYNTQLTGVMKNAGISVDKHF